MNNMGGKYEQAYKDMNMLHKEVCAHGKLPNSQTVSLKTGGSSSSRRAGKVRVPGG